MTPSPLRELLGVQRAASEPEADVWLSASAGTGKTHVLMARVLRLLLRPGLDPGSILCLTFTKAGAAEMAERIQSRLAMWVRLPEPDLRKELHALGEAHDDPATLRRARTLFARVLEVPGGLRIQTIHAFAGQLLAGFPVEAGLSPGFRPMEAREEALLARRTLADLVAASEDAGDAAFADALSALSRRLGEQKAEAFLHRCARAGDALDAVPDDFAGALRRGFGLPEGDVAAAISGWCADHPFDDACLGRLLAANRAWGGVTGQKHAEAILAWQALGEDARGGGLAALAKVVLTDKGTPRKVSSGQVKAEAGYQELSDRLGEALVDLLAMQAQAVLAEELGGALAAGRAYARAWVRVKRRAGVVDFDDLIDRVGALLAEPGIGDWIRYRLDQATDHILVDEGQDTNARQWSIVKALTEEYFAVRKGEPGVPLRTLFTVGDHKQAIFGFQGTDPVYFRAAETLFGRLSGDLRRLSLSRSFRSSPPVLAVVDALIDTLGAERLGLAEAPPPHESAGGGPGGVHLLPPLSTESDDDDAPEALGEEGWVDDAERRFAARLAEQVAEWLRQPLLLHGRKRALRPEDVMILVRRRGTLASLIVARLHAAGVPVAGVDRLRLGAPLAVRDLLAAARFAVQPDDDLTLAALLVSPLFGWDQERLGRLAEPERAGSLWRRLRAGGDAETVDALAALLASADFGTPFQFLEAILSGPMQGRHKLLGRLGAEARDPIEELLNAALAFEATGTPGLQRFLDWFDRDEVEIVRDPSAPLDAVRVMTVHGAKGLQAPLVILADACVDPERSPARELSWRPEGLDVDLPVFRPRKAELSGSLAEAAETADRREREEHWRLLYVAATRAEERLVVAGALGPAAKGAAPEQSWHAALARALDAAGAETVEDARWGAVRLHGDPVATASPARAAAAVRAEAGGRPDWLDRRAPEEARPPRPLAPSAPGDDLAADPPPSPALRAAAERGRLLHALFERLPAVPRDERAARADRWLAGSGGVGDPAARTALVRDALALIEDVRFAPIFSPAALAEAPLAAVVGGHVVAGTVDRLLVEADRILVVDFKTGRRAPGGLDEVPVSHLRQMGAYAAALSAIFPGRRVEAALLYTAGPLLLPLPAEVLALHRPDG